MRQALIAALLGMVMALGLAEGATRIIFPYWRDFSANRFIEPIQVGNIGGASIAPPGFDGYFAQNNGDFRVHIHADGLGLRNPDAAVADGALWSVGDSFTFGWGVERDETFGAVAARNLGLPFYSVSSPGTDVCGYRAMLARMPAGPKPRVVLMGLTLENDLEDYAGCGQVASRTADTGAAAPPRPWEGFRREMEKTLGPSKEWLTIHSALYNFAAVTVKRSPLVVKVLVALNLVADPRGVSWHTPDLPQAFMTGTARQVGLFAAALPKETVFAVVIVPTRFELMNPGSDWGALRRRVVTALTQSGIPVIDPADGLHAAGLGKVHFSHDGHWTPEGHRIAGEMAAKALKRKETP